MTLQTIPKAAVNGAIKIIRIPADALVGVAPDSRVGSSLGIAVDRVDASVRQVAGNALGDLDLKREAELLRKASDERRRALDLRGKAAARTETAEEKVVEARAAAEKQQQKAADEAARKRKEAEQRRKQSEANAAKA